MNALTPDFWMTVEPIIRKMRNENKSWAAICEHIGVSHNTMKQWRKRTDIAFASSCRNHSCSLISECVRLWLNTTESAATLGKPLGLNKNKFLGIVRRAGITNRVLHQLI